LLSYFIIYLQLTALPQVIEDPAVLQWWCRHFGSQQSSVPTDRVIQALLHDHPLYEKSRKETQVAMSAVMKVRTSLCDVCCCIGSEGHNFQDLVDANKDGDVSPQELVQFLQVRKPAVISLLSFRFLLLSLFQLSACVLTVFAELRTY
jgi:hypothetical protein